MAQLIVDLNSVESMAMAIGIINNMSGGNLPTEGITQPEPVVEEPVVEEPVVEEDDGLAELMMDEPEPAGPTVEDIKAAFKALAVSKGKDAAMSTVQTIFGKLGVKKMDEIAEDKRSIVIQILEKAAA
jgi:hypothetical protein